VPGALTVGNIFRRHGPGLPDWFGAFIAGIEDVGDRRLAGIPCVRMIAKGAQQRRVQRRFNIFRTIHVGIKDLPGSPVIQQVRKGSPAFSRSFHGKFSIVRVYPRR
jgi:hypothetical protein